MSDKDEQLSRWIAEFLEPESKLVDAGEYVRLWGWNRGTICWRTTEITSVAIWQPRNMVNDPAMTLMLLEKMLMERSYRQILLDAETCFNQQPRELNECEADHEACIFSHLHIYMHGQKLGRAIAETYATEHGWKGNHETTKRV